MRLSLKLDLGKRPPENAGHFIQGDRRRGAMGTQSNPEIPERKTPAHRGKDISRAASISSRFPSSAAANPGRYPGIY